MVNLLNLRFNDVGEQEDTIAWVETERVEDASDLTADESGYLVPPASSHSLFAKLYLNKLTRSDFGGNLPDKLDLRIYERGGMA